MALLLESTLTTNPFVWDLIMGLRKRLGDNRPDRYQFSDKVEKWDDDELLEFLMDSVDDFNLETPLTYFSLETCPDIMRGIILEGAFIYSLIRQGVLESNEKFSYSDHGLSLTLDKYVGYNAVWNTLLAAHIERRRRVKRQLQPSFLGLGSQRIPFAQQRVMSLIPSMKNTFGL